MIKVKNALDYPKNTHPRRTLRRNKDSETQQHNRYRCEEMLSYQDYTHAALTELKRIAEMFFYKQVSVSTELKKETICLTFIELTLFFKHVLYFCSYLRIFHDSVHTTRCWTRLIDFQKKSEKIWKRVIPFMKIIQNTIEL